MKKNILNILKVLIFLCVGLFLFWLIYKDQDMEVLKKDLQNINYWWMLLALLLGALSHVIRAVRWQQMVKPFGYHTRFSNSFFAVMSTYFANLAVPRLGEITRPTILKKYENIPFSISFGTIVLERIIDLFMLLVLTLILVLTQTHVFAEFLDNNPDIATRLDSWTSTYALTLAGSLFLLSILGVIFFWRKIKKTAIYKKFAHLIEEFTDGLKSFNKVPNKPLFIFYSLLIWGLYFLQTYVPVFAFEATSNLTIINGLVFFVIGSYGMVAPVQGGIGAWHFLIAGALVVLGINDQDARVYALVVHAALTLMIVVLGLISTILLPIVNTKQGEVPEHD